MSTGRSNAMDALPRGSFLTYFRPPNQSNRRTSGYRQCPPPPYSTYSRAPMLPRIPEDVDMDASVNDDEEAQQGFFDYYDPKEDGDEEDEHERRRTCFEVLSFLGYTLLVMLVVLNFDFLLSTFNASSGMVNWNAYGPNPETYMIHFCLDEPNREAPTSRVWRYIPTDSQEKCTTVDLRLLGDSSDEWKLLSEDRITGFGAWGGLMGGESVNTEIFGEDDDLAEEGNLNRRREGFM